jgi:hypothetical protein
LPYLPKAACEQTAFASVGEQSDELTHHCTYLA